jgi:hypothetical protein
MVDRDCFLLFFGLIVSVRLPTTGVSYDREAA